MMRPSPNVGQLVVSLEVLTAVVPVAADEACRGPAYTERNAGRETCARIWFQQVQQRWDHVPTQQAVMRQR